MNPSLTPHEDALRRIHARSARAPSGDLVDDAALRLIEAGEIEIARLMDAGQGTDAAFSLAVSVGASLIDTIASSAAAGDAEGPPDPALRRSAIATMLKALVETLSRPPNYRDSELVDTTATGLA